MFSMNMGWFSLGILVILVILTEMVKRNFVQVQVGSTLTEINFLSLDAGQLVFNTVLP